MNEPKTIPTENLSAPSSIPLTLVALGLSMGLIATAVVFCIKVARFERSSCSVPGIPLGHHIPGASPRVLSRF